MLFCKSSADNSRTENVVKYQMMKTLVVDLMWTDKIQRQKVGGEMFMIAGIILISKISFIQPMKISTPL